MGNCNVNGPPGAIWYPGDEIYFGFNLRKKRDTREFGKARITLFCEPQANRIFDGLSSGYDRGYFLNEFHHLNGCVVR
jgi:hypothetical protein